LRRALHLGGIGVNYVCVGIGAAFFDHDPNQPVAAKST